MASAIARVMGNEDHVPEPRAPERWLLVPRCSVFCFFRGVVFALRVVRRGRQPDAVYVGSVVGVTGGRLWFKPVGCVVPITIEVGAVAGAALLPEHTWAELGELKRRQKRGQPARVLPATTHKQLAKLERQRRRRRSGPRPITSPEKRTEP